LIGEIFDPGTHRPPVHWQTRFIHGNLAAAHTVFGVTLVATRFIVCTPISASNSKFEILFFPARAKHLLSPLKNLFSYLFEM
jgi:hypothetical protein